jgi:glycosyltransferase involved in cell wall biosynthesis
MRLANANADGLAVHFVTNQKAGLSGQRIYEQRLVETIRRQLSPSVSLSVVGGVRSTDADIRLPAGIQSRLPFALRRLLGRLVYASGDGIVHRLDLGAPPAANEILTVHDLAPLRFEDEGSLPRDARASIRAAAVVITASKFAAEEIRNFALRDRIEVIPHGVDKELWSTAPYTPDDLAAFGVGATFVLHAGGGSRRKNLSALALAWVEIARSWPDVTLVMCGPASAGREREFREVPQVRYLGPRSRSDLIRLMKASTFVVVPSTYEGFGLPVLEGMAAGVPVVASDTAVFREVAGDDAILVEPTSVGLHAGITSVLAGGGRMGGLIRRARERARPMTWEAAGERHVQLYRDISAQRERTALR